MTLVDSRQPQVPRPGDRVFVAAMTMVGLIALTGVVRGWMTTRPITPLGEPLTGVDPNIAPWWELATLPEIGEGTARAIVDHRERVRSDAALGAERRPEAAFSTPADLDAVRGIGPVTLHRISEHIRLGTP